MRRRVRPVIYKVTGDVSVAMPLALLQEFGAINPSIQHDGLVRAMGVVPEQLVGVLALDLRGEEQTQHRNEPDSDPAQRHCAAAPSGYCGRWFWDVAGHLDR